MQIITKRGPFGVFRGLIAAALRESAVQAPGVAVAQTDWPPAHRQSRYRIARPPASSGRSRRARGTKFACLSATLTIPNFLCIKPHVYSDLRHPNPPAPRPDRRRAYPRRPMTGLPRLRRQASTFLRQPRFFFGLMRDPADLAGMKAHAWVAAGRVPVTGGVSFGQFTVVGCFVAPCLAGIDQEPGLPRPPAPSWALDVLREGSLSARLAGLVRWGV